MDSQSTHGAASGSLDRLVRLLATALCNYECDEPYAEGETPPDMWPWAKIEKCLRMEHCGDCVDAPMSCPRCFVEDVLQKASWLAAQIQQPNVTADWVSDGWPHNQSLMPTTTRFISTGFVD